MKKNLLLKASALLTMLVLAFVVVGLPGTALAAVSAVTITPGAGQSYTIPVGGTVDLTATLTGTADGTMTYAWSAPTGGANVSFSSVDAATTTVTGLNPGTSATIRVAATETPGGTYTSADITITVSTMGISATTLNLEGGSSQTLTVSNVATGSTTAWTSNDTNVATVDPTSGLVTAVGAGSATITATNTAGSTTPQVKTCTVNVTPIITITPTSQALTTVGATQSVQLKVQYGGNLITASSGVSWSNSVPTAGSLTTAPTSFTVVNPTEMTATATFQAASVSAPKTTVIRATISGAGSYSTYKDSTITVRTSRYLTLEGDTALNKSDRYGDYTLTLHEADGSVVTSDSTSTAHWSWSSSYLSISSASLNSNRAKMTNGVAKIQLYARYNTPTAGTTLYAWINSETGNKVPIVIQISGLASLPQTGQDMTLVYILGGSAAALLAAAGVWYGIRKKRTAA